jgi:hypothetical protein
MTHISANTAHQHYEGPFLDIACRGQLWHDFRRETHQMAQAAYLLHVVWMQVANLFTRKTQIASMFHRGCGGVLNNRVLLWSVLSEVVIVVIVVWTPALDKIFEVRAVYGGAAVSCLWMVPVFILMEELRKFIVRKSPTFGKWLRM